MKRAFILTVALLAAALPALAEDPNDFSWGTITVGAFQTDSDTTSSKFLEYRDIPEGGVLPYFRYEGKKKDFRWDIKGADLTQRDQQYFFTLGQTSWTLKGDYTGIPHDFGNGGKSLLSPVKENEWRLSDTVQQAYQTAIVAVPPASARGQIDYNCERRFGFNPLPTCFSLLKLVTPGLDAAPANVDLKLQRQRANLSLDLTPGEGDFDLAVTYLHERRTGTRAANGTAFGFGNVVETPEPLKYITQDFGVSASFKGGWGVARAGVRFNDFKNEFDTFLWDNPFRVTDSTDGSAYLAPNTNTRNGAATGLMALAPDNKTATEAIGATFKLGAKTRFTADLAFGQWRQNEDPFIPWTTNTAIRTPDGQPAITAPLPATALDGKADTLSLSGFFTTRLADDLGLHARYRRYDFDNKTPRYRLEEGYVRFDAVWEDIPRITVPYGYTNDLFDVYATYGRGAFGVEVGYKHNKMARTFREAEDTSEDVFRAALDVRRDWFVLRGLGEFGSRDYSNYHAVEAEEHSFLEAGLPANQTVLRRYDQANRDLTRVGGQIELSPGGGKFSLFASYLHTKFEYDQSPVECEDVDLFTGQARFCPGGEQKPLGLVNDQYDTFSVEASFSPSAKTTVYAFYDYEDGDILQTGRQSAATLNFNPNDVWTANITTKGHSVGAGAELTLVPEKWFLRLFARYQDIDGNNDVSLLPGYSTSIYGGDPTLQQCVSTAGPCAIAPFDDTKLTYVYASLRYQFAKRWSAGAGVGFEDYEIQDAQTGNTLNYMPASFFLQANNRDYQAFLGYVNLTYRFD
jgi:MtrB/PioB family decaheme-associated outer membrane protein